MANISKMRINGVVYDIIDTKTDTEITSIKENYLSKLEAMGLYVTKEEANKVYIKKDDVSYDDNTLIIEK